MDSVGVCESGEMGPTLRMRPCETIEGREFIRVVKTGLKRMQRDGTAKVIQSESSNRAGTERRQSPGHDQSDGASSPVESAEGKSRDSTQWQCGRLPAVNKINREIKFGRGSVNVRSHPFLIR
jgi:hypothetical protein